MRVAIWSEGLGRWKAVGMGRPEARQSATRRSPSTKSRDLSLPSRTRRAALTWSLLLLVMSMADGMRRSPECEEGSGFVLLFAGFFFAVFEFGGTGGIEGGVGFGEAGVDVLAPSLEGGAHGFGALGFPGGQVVGLGEVGGEVIEFDVVVLEELDEFPVALADGAGGGAVMVVGEVPVEGSSR